MIVVVCLNPALGTAAPVEGAAELTRWCRERGIWRRLIPGGTVATGVLEQVTLDIAFLGVDAIDVLVTDGGINPEDAALPEAAGVDVVTA